MKKQADIGMIGLAVMGQNLVLNMADHGYTVAVYNRTVEITDEFLDHEASGKPILGARSVQELVSQVQKPRKIMLMVKAGAPVDAVIEQLLPFLDNGDIIIDGGNSFFKDTIRRQKYLEGKGLRFIGTGVSGGEEGARHGPSIMPGGSASAWPEIKKIFQDISAKVGPNNDVPCCDWIGQDGAGHFVKMVHNGIEYGDMELISEAYFVLKTILNKSPDEMGALFERWNEGVLDSYLVEITAAILQKRDDMSGNYLIDMILDKAGQKGTGVWTSITALELGVPIPTLMEATVARAVSAAKKERLEIVKSLGAPNGKKEVHDPNALIRSLHDALYAAKILSYTQGFQLMRAASDEYAWNLDYGRIAYLWRGGCIIRARFLEQIKQAFDDHRDLKNLMLAPYFSQTLLAAEKQLRDIVCTATQSGVPVPAFSSALAYFDAFRTEVLPAHMIQAQRDYFGAHTYERIDRAGTFHTEWTKP
ncbi:decarboxylating NADP(+)-dependent phosphogluconate dehydrogenase [Candidatus Uhrbacteria bacterium]|nr:decarboxylating NADP(+)-dependent phosphogluconate dehydrogenase [Candidatus Uhrbacteria bacterium]